VNAIHFDRTAFETWVKIQESANATFDGDETAMELEEEKSSSASTPASSLVSRILTGTALLAAKRDLLALPSGLVRTMAGKHTTKGKSKGGAGKGKSRVGSNVNRYYNEAASRPVPRNGISLEQQITVEFCGVTNVFVTTNAAGLLAGASAVFAVSTFGGSTAALGLFDQYRFDQVECWIDPLAPPGTTLFGNVVTCVDLDDGAAVSTMAQVQDHPGALLATGGAGHYHKWKPHMAVAVYSGAFTSFANEVAGWIDSASPNVQHYGIKIATQNFTTAVAYSLTTRAVISFRAPGIA
jgi:hypothetical protein